MSSLKPLTREDWIGAGREMWSQTGVTSLAVDVLAKRLNISRGSFYWHFKNRAELIEAVLSQWERMEKARIADLNAISDPRARLHALFASPINETNLLFEARIVSDSSDDAVAPYSARWINRWRRWARKTYGDMGFTREEADYRAVAAFACYVGMLKIFIPSSGKKPAGKWLAGYARVISDLFIPANDIGH